MLTPKRAAFTLACCVACLATFLCGYLATMKPRANIWWGVTDRGFAVVAEDFATVAYVCENGETCVYKKVTDCLGEKHFANLLDSVGEHPPKHWCKLQQGLFGSAISITLPNGDVSTLVVEGSCRWPEGEIAAITAMCRDRYRHARIAHAALAYYNNNKGHASTGSLLSWRVHLLPYLGYGKLHSAIRSNLPWTASENREFQSQMPSVYSRDLESRSGYSDVAVSIQKGMLLGDDGFWRRPSMLVFEGKYGGHAICYSIKPVLWMAPDDGVLGLAEQATIIFSDMAVWTGEAKAIDERLWERLQNAGLGVEYFARQELMKRDCMVAILKSIRDNGASARMPRGVAKQ